MSNEWYHEFFTGVYHPVQLQSWTEEQTRDHASLVEKFLSLSPGDRVLDVPCGDGRLTEELARRGCVMTGVDFAPPMLEKAAERARAAGVTIDLVERDMRDLDWSGEFDAALCFWGSFGYFDEQGDRQFVRSVAKGLKPGGRFLIETQSAESLLPQFREKSWTRVGDTIVLNENRYDHTTGRIDGIWTFIRDGAVDPREKLRPRAL